MNPTDNNKKNNKNTKKKEFDKRKVVFLSIVFLAVMVFIAIGSSKVDSQKVTQSSLKKVEGAATSIDPVENIKNAVEDKIGTIQEEASNIDVAEVASSSPQVQKIINDIKSLQDYPSDQAKSLCEKVCSGL
jgi:hypothetical protein